MVGETGIYRLYDDAGQLLYVGIGANPFTRITEHRRASWGGAIARVEVEWAPNRREALLREAQAIATENPAHNKVATQCRVDRASDTLPVRLSLAASAEIAALLGVSRQRVQQLTTRPGFPEPVAELAAATIWLESDVRAWAASRGRGIAA